MPNTSVFDWLLADDQRKTIYCAVSKACSTSWKYMLIKQQNPDFKAPKTDRAIHVHSEKTLRKHGLRYLKNYTEEEALHRIRTNFKYIIVRNPLDRILSAYRDKLQQADEPYYATNVAGYIKENFRAKNESREKNVTFGEFVQYILSQDPLEMDRHWMSINLLCQPCFVGYDVIIKQETMETDGPHLLERLSLNASLSQLPFFNSHRGKTDSLDTGFMGEYRKHVSPEDYRRLLLMLHTDMQMFGYEAPPYLINPDEP